VSHVQAGARFSSAEEFMAQQRLTPELDVDVTHVSPAECEVFVVDRPNRVCGAWLFEDLFDAVDLLMKLSRDVGKIAIERSGPGQMLLQATMARLTELQRDRDLPQGQWGRVSGYVRR
jgi:hypothetical protein